MSDAYGWSAHRDAVATGSFLRLVNFHNTLATDRDHLRGALSGYAERFAPMDLADLDAWFAGEWESTRPGFIPVFYEGFRNAYEVAGPVCEELGLTGWFAICTGFVDCAPPEQEVFARSHWLFVMPEEADRDRLAMTWDEIADLSTRHVVFPHTAAHEGVAETPTDVDLRREVVEPKRRLDAVTGQDSAAFAWMGGSPYGQHRRHDAALREAGYRYVISNTLLQRIG